MQKSVENSEDAKGTILLLDDDPVYLSHGRRILGDAGYHVIPAQSAIKGLEILESRQDIDLIVTDNLMPGLTGLEMAELLYCKSHDMPVVMVSADLHEKVITMGRRVGIRWFLQKPYQEVHTRPGRPLCP